MSLFKNMINKIKQLFLRLFSSKKENTDGLIGYWGVMEHGKSKIKGEMYSYNNGQWIKGPEIWQDKGVDLFGDDFKPF